MPLRILFLSQLRLSDRGVRAMRMLTAAQKDDLQIVEVKFSMSSECFMMLRRRRRCASLARACV
jgi:hypothetical protein